MNKDEIKKRMDQILTLAEKEKRNLTDAEEIELSGLELEMKKTEIIESQPRRSIPMGKMRFGGDAVEEVRSWGVVGGLRDVRALYRGRPSACSDMTPEAYMIAAAEGRTMLSGVGADGGFFAPEAWNREILQSVNSTSIALPRCRIFPMGDRILHISLWDSENQTQGYFGGVVPQWKGEAGTFTATSPKLREVLLRPFKLGIYVNLSREAAQDAAGIASEVSNRMAFSISQTFDQKILTGNGVAEPLGVLNAAATVTQTRAAANQIAWADVCGMLARLHPAFVAGSAWYANPSTLSQLLALADASSRAIWLPANGDVSGSSPGYLYGRPLYLTDKTPALGTKGDLMLCDLSMYAVGMRQEISVERSESAEWYADLISLRSIMRADGRPLLDAPITPQNGGSDLSAFVVLS